METKSEFDGLVIKHIDSPDDDCLDCHLCCLNKSKSACECCPLKVGFYFAKPDVPPVSPAPSRMSISDKSKIGSIISDLDVLSKYLKDSYHFHHLSSACVELASTSLHSCLSCLNRISSFDE